jgi:hypothetical protein
MLYLHLVVLISIQRNCYHIRLLSALLVQALDIDVWKGSRSSFNIL